MFEKGTFEEKKSFVKFAQTKSEHAHVGAHTERVGQRGHPVDDLFVGVRDESLADLVLALEQKVEYATHRALGQNGLLVEMHDPVLVVQHVHVLFERVLKRPRLVATTRLARVRRRHDDLAYARVFRQVDVLVGHDFHDEFVQTFSISAILM